MITEQQKESIIELYKQGMSKTQIAKKKKISRTKIIEILKDFENSNVAPDNKNPKQEEDIESDPEIIKLKKEAIKEKYKREIRELKEPFETEKKLKELGEDVELLNTNVETLFVRLSKNLADGLGDWKCKNCGTKGKVSLSLKCSACNEITWWGWQVH